MMNSKFEFLNNTYLAVQLRMSSSEQLRRTVMAHYLVTANPKTAKLDELQDRLARDEFVGMNPFGRSLTKALRGARLRNDGVAVWEEEDYCAPPLAEERAAVLDAYFDSLAVEPVTEGKGWLRITDLPRLFPDLHAGVGAGRPDLSLSKRRAGDA